MSSYSSYSPYTRSYSSPHGAQVNTNAYTSSYGGAVYGGLSPASALGVGSGYSSRNSSTSSLTGAVNTSSRYGGSRYGSDAGLGSSSSLYDSSSSSRYSSSRDRPTSYSSGASYSRSYTPTTSFADKEVDYKRLFEQQKAENEKLKKDLQKLQADLSDSKMDLEKSRLRNETAKSFDTSIDKREKRALERRISELEEELKAMDNLKADNQRLKEENGALIRVISKLSK